MGRFSPTVTPVANTGLADALGAFTETYMQAQNRKDRRQREDQELDARMLASGYAPDVSTEPASAPSGTFAALKARLTGRTDPNGIATAIEKSAPAVQGANDVNARLAEALSSGENGGPMERDRGFVERRPPSGASYALNESPTSFQQQGAPPAKPLTTFIGNRRYRETDEARTIRDERRRRDALASALSQGQLDHLNAETELLRHPLPKAPVMGTPEWEAAIDTQSRIQAQNQNRFGFHAPPTQFSFGTTVDANGNPVVLRQNTKTGEVTPTDAVKPATGQGGGRGSATIQKAVAENKTNMSVIDDAVKELNAHPQAVGAKRGLADLPLIGGFGDAANQRFDPTGVAARASLSNVASLVIKDRSGSAVSVSESARLRPFIPSVGDTPDAIRVKLRKLKAAIQTETDLLERGGSASSHGIPDHAAPAATTSHVPSYEEWLASKTK